MRKRFIPEHHASVKPAGNLIDPEAYDASEQMFAASLEQNVKPKPRFVVEESNPSAKQAEAANPEENAAPGVKDTGICDKPQVSANVRGEEKGVETSRADTNQKDELLKSAVPEQTMLPGYPDPAAWRQEVAARLDSYQARRGSQEPRYPSLRLKFEEEPTASRQSIAPEIAPLPSFTADGSSSAGAAAKRGLEAPAGAGIGTSGDIPTRVIHFPRSSAVTPPSPLSELAEPVFERPRILEAPEVAPAPPALGGIFIEHAEEPEPERRPGFEIPLAPASMALRMFAAGLDAVLVIFATVLFEYIFFRVTDATMSRLQAVGIGLAFGMAFWAGYQFLLLVFAGSTPGLQLVGLRLSRFDDTPASQRSRRWRALASMLSILSLGLGYAWCFLDEDQLCWHDRITGTYLSAQHPSHI